MSERTERGTVDGVTVLHAGHVPGRHAAALVFRVGRFDESLPSLGVTHLTEHLAVAGSHPASYRCNAAVDGRFTSFFMESTDPADIAHFLTGVCRGLVSDGRELLEREKRILQTEAASRGGSGAAGRCLNERYGAAGPGLAAYDELGLHQLRWEDVEAWRSRWFVAANAVLWIAGTIPPGLRLALPPGPAPAVTAHVPLSLQLPGYLAGGQDGVGFSMVTSRSIAAAVTVGVMQRRLLQVLRHDRGLSYGVQGGSQLLDAGLSHVWLTADALPDQVPAVAHTALTALEELAASGCTAGEIADCARRAREASEAPGGIAASLQAQAENILDRRPVLEQPEVLAQTAAVSPGAVAAAARELLSSAIVVTPQAGPAVQGRMPPLPRWSQRTLTGQRWHSTRSGAVLTIGTDGVMLTVRAGQQVTVPFADVAGLLRWQDGTRMLIGRDGFAVRIDLAEWPAAAAALAMLDSRISPHLIVSLPGAGSSPAGPAAPRLAGPLPLRAQLRSPAAWRSGILWALLGFCALFGAMAMGGGDRQAWGLLAVGLSGLGWRLAPALRHGGWGGPPPPGRGPGARILRALLACWTGLAVIFWSAGTPGAFAAALAGVAAIAAEEFIARRRRAAAARM